MQTGPGTHDYYDVFLVAPGPNRAKCLVLLKELLQCTSNEADTQLESGQVLIATGSSLMVRDVVTRFESIGAQTRWVLLLRHRWQDSPCLHGSEKCWHAMTSSFATST